VIKRFMGTPFLFKARQMADTTVGISHVVAGTTLPPTGPRIERAVAALLVVSPLVLFASIAFARSVASRPMQELERVINEVEAIKDGRSLHRRLATGHANDELSRLATTLNEMMQRLETSFSALRTFTADASHELNTPLTVMRADVERAMDPATTDDERLVALEEALHEVRRMTDLVDSLLTLARADEGRFDLHREPVDLAALVADVYETALLLAEDAGLSVKLTLLEHATVPGDAARLRQLFLNLVTNAIKYTPEGGRVELSLGRRLDGVAFAVRDSGIGISAADLPHIFERFWRADRSRSRATEPGFGLGLPICNWIAQAHGGSIVATSKLGKGSTFTVTLPLEENGAGEGAVPVAAALVADAELE
jgi:signal transduction histidine kinase